MDATSAGAGLGEDDRIVFHGTSDAFDAFDLGRCGRGGDANSHLGVHLAEEARDAAEYAEAAAARRGGEARVLVVRATTVNPFAGFDYHRKLLKPRPSGRGWRACKRRGWLAGCKRCGTNKA